MDIRNVLPSVYSENRMESSPLAVYGSSKWLEVPHCIGELKMNQTVQPHNFDLASCPSKTAGRRVGPLIAGTSMALLGLSRRSKSGLALAVAGGALAYFGSRRNGPEEESVAYGSVLLNCSPQEAYVLYRNFEDLPLFMQHLESVTKLGERQYRWIALGPMGMRIRWDAEIVRDREGELLSWRSLPDSDVSLESAVRFQTAPGNRGTLVRAFIHFDPPDGKLKRAVAKLFSTFLVQQDLRRFKALIETGEIPTIEGQTHGPRSRLTAALRVADPNRPPKGDSDISEVFSAKRRTA
jgi:uncharacterized membrane protein